MFRIVLINDPFRVERIQQKGPSAYGIHCLAGSISEPSVKVLYW